MWLSMSASTSLSSSIFGFAKTAKPTLRNASTQGRTTSALPGAMLVKTVASGSSVTSGPRGRQFGRPRQQPAAQRIETGPVRGGRPAAEDRPQAHVEVGGVPDQQHPGGRVGRRPAGGATSSVCRMSSVTLMAFLPEQFGDGAARVLRLVLVLRDGPLDRNRQRILGGDSAQPRLGVAHFGDVLGVSRVVRRGVQHPAGPQPIGDQRDRGRLQQPAFVVACLRPRVGEEHPHSGQRVGPEHVLEDVDAVAADQPDVGDAFAVDAGSSWASPRRYTSTATTSR